MAGAPLSGWPRLSYPGKEAAGQGQGQAHSITLPKVHVLDACHLTDGPPDRRAASHDSRAPWQTG